MGKFDDIMQLLNPKEVIATTEVPHDNARASFKQPNSIVSSHKEFQDILMSYVAHDFNQTLKTNFPPDLCLHIARTHIDSQDRYDNAVYISMSGTKGGINYVLNLINEGFKSEAKKAYFTYIMDKYVDPIDFDEVVDLMREFKQKLGGYAPSSFNFITPENMAGDYKRIIWSYIDNLTHYRNLWTY